MRFQHDGDLLVAVVVAVFVHVDHGLEGELTVLDDLGRDLRHAVRPLQLSVELFICEILVIEALQLLEEVVIQVLQCVLHSPTSSMSVSL